MNTILYGNGFNRLNNETSWESLVHIIDDTNDKYKIPNTLQYEGKVLSMPYQTEALLLTKDGKRLISSDGKSLIVKEESETLVKQAIVKQMESYRSNDLFDRLINLRVEHLLTTNYDYVADNALISFHYYEEKKERDKSERTFSIHRKMCYIKESQKKYLWKIHGELSNIGSIMLGYNHYCNYVGQIKAFITGNYEFAKKAELGIISKIEDRLPIISNDIISWIDLFFCSDIYIIGLGLYYDEIDLWWVLTLRKRLRQRLGSSFVKNTIFFYGELELGMESMLEHLDVQIISSKSRKYEQKYTDYINDINKRIK